MCHRIFQFFFSNLRNLAFEVKNQEWIQGTATFPNQHWKPDQKR